MPITGVQCLNCETYQGCLASPDKSITVGHDVVEDEPVRKTGQEFTEYADKFCTGPRVFVANNSEVQQAERVDDKLIVPSTALLFQCENPQIYRKD